MSAAAKTESHYHASAQRLSSILGTIVFGLGLWGLIVWKFIASYLSDRAVKLVTMAPIAAVLFMILGIALWAYQEKRINRFKALGNVCVSLVLLISAASLLDYFLDLNIRLSAIVLDLLNAQRATGSLFEIVINAQFGIFILGSAIVLMGRRAEKWHYTSQIGAFLVGMTGLATLTGYLYTFSPLYFAITSNLVVALPAAIALACGSFSTLLLRPELGFIPVLLSRAVSGVAARRFLLLSIVVPFSVGAVLANAQRVTRLSVEVSILVFAIAVILLSFILVYYNARSLSKSEQTARESREDLDRAQAVSHTGSWRLNVRRNELLWSEEAYRIFNVPKGTSLTYEKFLSYIHPEDRAYVDRTWNEALKGETYDIDHRIIVDNNVKWVREKSELEFDHNGVLLGGFGTVQDITDRRNVEESLRRREEELRTITANSPDVIARFDRQMRHTFINPSGEKVYGRTREEVIGKSSAELGMPQDKVALWTKPFHEAFTSGKHQNVEFDFESPDLGRQYFLSAFVPEKDEKGNVVSILAISRDITQLKEVQKHLSDAVREAKRRADEAEEGRRILDALMDNIPEGIMVADAEGRIRSISKYLSQISGHEKQEVTGKSYRTVDELLHEPPALIDRRRGERLEHQEAGAATAVAESPLAMEYPLRRALEKGEVTINEEHAVYLPNGTILTAVLNSAPIRDAGGRIIGAVTSWLDITDRKKAEESLKASNRELEQFAYVASHDLQEPLRMVTSFTELFERRYKELVDERGRKYVNYIVDGASRMQNLIQDLLTFSRAGRLDTERHRVDLNEVVNYVVTDLSKKIRETQAEVTHDQLPSLNANETAMARVFMNLISNAIKFRRQGVSPNVHVSVQRSGNEWRFSVSDNGIGIDPKYFGKLFVIFQRLHGREEYPGTGMGLAICRKIVENYGGRIWVESQPGKGSTFYFTIPHQEKS